MNCQGRGTEAPRLPPTSRARHEDDDEGFTPSTSSVVFSLVEPCLEEKGSPRPPPKTFGLAVPCERGQAAWQSKTKALRSPIRNPNRRPDFSTACGGQVKYPEEYDGQQPTSKVPGTFLV